MNRISSVSRYQGFSLIELMIAMVIGLILLAGVGTVFISTQQTLQTKRALDNAQEALRYAHQSISRIVKSGEINDASDANRLVITFNRSAVTPDCLGGDLDAEVEVVYSLNPNDELECSVDGNDSGILSRNITGFDLQYKKLGTAADDWTGINDKDAVSVRVNLTFSDPTDRVLIDTSFVATSRQSVIDGHFASSQ